MPVIQNLLAFNTTVSEPSGILPKLPITLEGNTICIDITVVQGPLDVNFRLWRDYAYAMKVVVSKLFHVVSFLLSGKVSI